MLNSGVRIIALLMLLQLASCDEPKALLLYQGQKKNLTSVPSDLSAGSSYKIINLSYNNITSIDSMIFIDKNLLQFDISYNPEFKFQEGSTFLQSNVITSLNLRGCNIDRIYNETFQELTSLEALFLRNNKLKVIEDGSFANNIQLYELDLGKNRLTTLNCALFDNVTNMTKIKLDNNPWNCTCQFLRCLEKLNITDVCTEEKKSLPDICEVENATENPVAEVDKGSAEKFFPVDPVSNVSIATMSGDGVGNSNTNPVDEDEIIIEGSLYITIPFIPTVVLLQVLVIVVISIQQCRLEKRDKEFNFNFNIADSISYEKPCMCSRYEK